MSSLGLRYNGKVTIVTGGSQGIGEGCVRVFVEHGSQVVFCAKTDGEGVKLQDELNATGPGECYYVKCDMTIEEDVQALITKTIEKYGKLDCLINNAGAHPPHQLIDDITKQGFHDLLDLNTLGHFLASKYALPHLRKTQGNIINDSSLVGQIGQQGAVAYVTTKGAIAAMTKAMAIDEAKHGVRVNAFSPGNIWTPMWQYLSDASSDPQAMIDAGRDAQLLGRFGTIREAGLMCLFLAADATFCTGIDVPLSGGAELNYGNKNPNCAANYGTCM